MLSLLNFDDIIPISNNSIKKELLLVYPTGGLGEYYLTKILTDFRTRQIPNWNYKKHYNDYITYTTQLYSKQSVQFHYDELFLKNNYIDFDELEKFIATHKKDLDINDCKFCHSHVPPVVITHLYNLKFKKTIFIKPKKNINSILLKISSCRTLVNDGKLNDMMIEANVNPKDFFLQLFNENDVLNIFEFSDVYELSKQKIVNCSDCYEEISFDDLLNEDHTHVKNIKLMTDNMLNFLMYET